MTAYNVIAALVAVVMLLGCAVTYQAVTGKAAIPRSSWHRWRSKPRIKGRRMRAVSAVCAVVCFVYAAGGIAFLVTYAP